MRLKRLVFFLFIFSVSQFFIFNHSWAVTIPAVKQKKTAIVQKKVSKKIQSIKKPPPVIGSYFIANDKDKCLGKKNQTRLLPIASLTKLMTALVLVENRNREWQETITYDPERHYVYGNYLRLVKDDIVSIKDLFNSMLVASVNEPARMLVEATNLNEKEFIKKMNYKAKALGMEKTRYVDTSGFSPLNVSTAEDQVKLLQEVFSYPELRETLKMTNYSFEEIFSADQVQVHNFKHTNSLIGQTKFEILASKTGYLDEAKNCLAMVVEKNGRVYFVVTLNDPGRYRDFGNTKKLVEKIIF